MPHGARAIKIIRYISNHRFLLLLLKRFLFKPNNNGSYIIMAINQNRVDVKMDCGIFAFLLYSHPRFFCLSFYFLTFPGLYQSYFKQRGLQKINGLRIDLMFFFFEYIFWLQDFPIRSNLLWIFSNYENLLILSLTFDRFIQIFTFIGQCYPFWCRRF